MVGSIERLFFSLVSLKYFIKGGFIMKTKYVLVNEIKENKNLIATFENEGTANLVRELLVPYFKEGALEVYNKNVDL